MNNHSPSSTTSLLQSQFPVGCETYSPFPPEKSSYKQYETGLITTSVNDTVGYGSINDKSDTTNEGSDQNILLVTKMQESRLNIIYRKLQKRRGLALTVFAVLFYSFHALVVDSMTTDLNPFQISVMIFPVPLLGSLLLIICKRISPVWNFKVMLLHIVAGTSLFYTVCCLTFSFEYVPLGDAVAISFVTLILVGILSWIILREPLRLYDLSLALIALAGIVCIARPSFIFGSSDKKQPNSNTLLGAALGLGTAFASSMVMVTVRKLSQLGEHSLFSIFANDLIVLLFNGTICLATREWQSTGMTIWLWCLGGGTAFFIGQVSFYIALSTESATLVNIVATVQIVLSFILEFLFFHIVPSWTSAVGGALIMLASVGAVVKKPVDDEQQAPESILSTAKQDNLPIY